MSTPNLGLVPKPREEKGGTRTLQRHAHTTLKGKSKGDVLDGEPQRNARVPSAVSGGIPPIAAKKGTRMHVCFPVTRPRFADPSTTPAEGKPKPQARAPGLSWMFRLSVTVGVWLDANRTYAGGEPEHARLRFGFRFPRPATGGSKPRTRSWFGIPDSWTVATDRKPGTRP